MALPDHIRIATRGSPLALWQTAYVERLLRTAEPSLHIDIVPIITTGDRVHGPLAAHGGKALYVQEIEEALMAGTVDLAVHSLKDLPGKLPTTLTLFATTEREEAWDLFVARSGDGPYHLQAGARVGTASLRRQWQLHAMRPDLRIEAVRGNVETRLRKLLEGEYDALVMAAAGLKRLRLTAPSITPLPVDQMIPAIGQGVIVVEGRSTDATLHAMVRRACHHHRTGIVAAVERAILRAVGGNCYTPLAAYAEYVEQGGGPLLRVRTWLATPDGTRAARIEETVALSNGDEECLASIWGRAVGERLVAKLGHL